MKKVTLVLSLLQLFFITSLAAETTYEFPIQPKFKYVSDFNRHGMAVVTDDNGQRVVIDTSGNKIFSFDNREFALRKNGTIMVLGENEMAAFFDGNGKQLTDYIYDVYKNTTYKMPKQVRYSYLTDMYDGDGKGDLVPISRNKKFGYINSQGVEVIPPTYEYVYGFYNGVSRIGSMGNLSSYGTYTSGKFGYINERGEVLYPADSLWSAEDFTKSFARIADGEFKVIDTFGNEVDLQTGEYLPEKAEGGLILAQKNGESIVFDYYGNVVVESDWRKKDVFGGSIIIENKQLLAPNGRLLYEAPEDVVILSSPYGDINFKRITKNITETETVSGLINPKGEVVFPCEYNNIRELGDGLIYAENYNGKNIIYNERGRVLCVLNGQVRGKPSMGLIPVLDFDTMKYGYIKYPFKIEGKISSEFLYNLGLFKGVSDEGTEKPNFDLNREATRPEALAMLVRSLGKEAEAQNHPKTHPFTDVPQWADGYVSYAFENGITKGISDTEFGVSFVMDSEYLTFMLRALGYNEDEDGYTWDNPYNFANLKGIQNRKSHPFLRSNMTDITYHALYAKIKNKDISLWEQLENQGAIEKGLAPREKSPTKTYEEAIDEITPNDSYVIIGKIDTEECLIVQSVLMGTPHGSPYALRLVYKSGSSLGEGTTITLPIPPSNGWGLTNTPDEISLSEDKNKLYYSIYSEVGIEGLREKGNYEYSVNLQTGEVMLNLNKQYIKNDISSGDAVKLCYDKYGMNKGYSFTYLHTVFENEEKYHIIQKSDYSQTVENEKTQIRVSAKTGAISP